MKARTLGFISVTLSLLILLTPGIPAHASPTRATNGRIAFERVSRHSGSLFELDPDGSNLVRIVHSKGIYFYSAAWSPDGTRLAFVRTFHGRRTALIVSDADGTNRQQIHSFRSKDGQKQIYTPDWSPDGTEIAFSILNVFTDRGDSFLIHPDGSGFKPLTNHLRGSQLDPSWSPNGGRIAFDDPGVQHHTFRGSRIAVLSLATHKLHKVTFGFEPDWSVNGRIYFSDGEDLCRIRPNGSRKRRLTHTKAPEGSPAVSPNGQAIAYVVGRRNPDIKVLHLSTGRVTPVVTTKAKDIEPAWQPIP